MILITSLVAYAVAMTLANLSVAEFGLVAVPVNAFLLIGLDLTLRDWLHTKIKPSQMFALIVASGALTYMLNPAAGQIALASATAFTVAAVADWMVFSRLRGTWLLRANGSNVVGAVVDSLVFPLMAFGGLSPTIFTQMLAAKLAGGAVWAYLLRPRAATM